MLKEFDKRLYGVWRRNSSQGVDRPGLDERLGVIVGHLNQPRSRFSRPQLSKCSGCSRSSIRIVDVEEAKQLGNRPLHTQLSKRFRRELTEFRIEKRLQEIGDVGFLPSRSEAEQAVL